MDIKNLNYLTMIRLDVSIWSARAKLRREDLPSDANLPPEEMATLGSKRLFDPERIKTFNTIKARAVSTLDKKCVRFLGGWATHEDRLEELARALDEIADDFNYEKTRFIRDYTIEVEKWINQFPEWENILRAALPQEHELPGKFAYNFQMFKVAPAETGGSYFADNMHSTLSSLERTLLDEVARSIGATYKECFNGKETVTKKAFRPMRTLLDKIRGLTFLHPNIAGLEVILAEAIDMVEENAQDKGHVTMFKNLMLAMQSGEAIDNLCADFIQNNSSAQETLSPFWAFECGPMPTREQKAEVKPVAIVPPHFQLPQPDASYNVVEWDAVDSAGQAVKISGPIVGTADRAELARALYDSLVAQEQEPGSLTGPVIAEAQRILDHTNGPPEPVPYTVEPVLDEEGNIVPGKINSDGLW